jgi:hypothetical protein
VDAEAASDIKFIRRRVSQQINAASAPVYQMRTAAKTDSATKLVSSLTLGAVGEKASTRVWIWCADKTSALFHTQKLVHAVSLLYSLASLRNN